MSHSHKCFSLVCLTANRLASLISLYYMSFLRSFFCLLSTSYFKLALVLLPEAVYALVLLPEAVLALVLLPEAVYALVLLPEAVLGRSIQFVDFREAQLTEES